MNKRLNFKYIFDDDYNPKYVNGAYGGINPQGEIAVNFYVERSPIPRTEIYSLNEDGSLDSPIEIEPENHTQNIIRFIETGILLNLENAKKIHQWLGQHITSLESLKN